MVLMQDGAKPHWFVHRNAGGSCRETGVTVLEGWPSGSPDLNPIERLWARLDTRVADRGPYGVEELRKFVLEEFLAVPDQFIEDLALSFKQRLKDCIENGGQTVKN
jgi:transposase